MLSGILKLNYYMSVIFNWSIFVSPVGDFKFKRSWKDSKDFDLKNSFNFRWKLIFVKGNADTKDSFSEYCKSESFNSIQYVQNVYSGICYDYELLNNNINYYPIRSIQWWWWWWWYWSHTKRIKILFKSWFEFEWKIEAKTYQ